MVTYVLNPIKFKYQSFKITLMSTVEDFQNMSDEELRNVLFNIAVGMDAHQEKLEELEITVSQATDGNVGMEKRIKEEIKKLSNGLRQQFARIDQVIGRFHKDEIEAEKKKSKSNNDLGAKELVAEGEIEVENFDTVEEAKEALEEVKKKRGRPKKKED